MTVNLNAWKFPIANLMNNLMMFQLNLFLLVSNNLYMSTTINLFLLIWLRSNIMIFIIFFFNLFTNKEIINIPTLFNDKNSQSDFKLRDYKLYGRVYTIKSKRNLGFRKFLISQSRINSNFSLLLLKLKNERHYCTH